MLNDVNMNQLISHLLESVLQSFYEITWEAIYLAPHLGETAVCVCTYIDIFVVSIYSEISQNFFLNTA